MKKNIFRNKKILIGIGSLATLVAAPIILTSCSSIDKTLIEKTFSKGNGTSFANNYSIAQVAEQALKTDAGAKAMASNVANTLLLDWFDRLSKESGQEVTKRAYDSQKKTVDDDYKNELKNSTNTNGANHELKFQQDQLDPNGGTEDSWKKKKMLEWAKSEFATRLFEKDYLAVVDINDSNSVTMQPTIDQIRKSVKNDGYKFAFTENAIQNGNKNPYADKEYAKFQQFIFDQWVQVENPYIINMVLWKYGTPKEGISNIYNKDASSISDKTATGNYSFPYFATNGTSNSNGGPITQFTNFVNDAKNDENYYSSEATENELGIRNIDKGYTTDSSTLIFAKNGSIYNDLYIEFAAASSYLFQKAYSKTTTSTTNWEKDITTTASNGLDVITSNFISTTTSSNPSAVKIKSDLAKKFINMNGPLKTLANNDIYAIDAFQPNANSKLNDFLFIRDEAGVHAIAIEGQKYIASASDEANAKKNAAQIVLFHYFLGKSTENKQGLEIDIKTELTNFYNNNTDYLITKYIETNKEQKIFNPSILDLNLKYLYESYSNYAMELSKIDKVKEYNEKMFSQKQTYSNNYGVDAKKNGFASGWIFTKTNNIYDVANTVKLPNSKDPFETGGTYSKYLERINPYISALNLKPLTSNFGGFKYSQYIYSNDFIVNSILLAYGSDSNSMGDSMKVDILSKYLDTDFDLNTLKFKDQAFAGKTKTELDTALINNYFSSTFNGLTNKWTQYTETTFDKDKLNNYKFDLYKKSMNVKNNATITNQVSLLTLISTAKYLLNNNGQEFLNYLKTKIVVGEDSYIAWVNTYNSTLTTKPNNITKVSDLLSVNNMQQNVNNNYTSAYTGLKTNNAIVDVSQNNADAYISNEINNYYNFVDGKLGYMGLINQDSTINSVAIKNRLFVDPTIDNSTKKGVLFSYGSKQDLLNLIDSYSYESEISELTTDLMNKTKAFDAGQIFESATEIEQKKTILKGIVNDTTKFTDAMFQRRDNYIGQQPTGNTNNSDATPVTDNSNGDNIKSGAFVYQINNSDLKDWSSFEQVFSSSSSKNDIIYNLLFTAAADTNIQATALVSILENSKLTVYDTRLNTQLGPKWITNWKN